MIFRGDSRLKEITENDLTMVYNWRNQTRIRAVMLNGEPIHWNKHLDWFANNTIDSNTISKIFYYNDMPYGVLNVKGISSPNRCCNWGFYLGEEKAPKGLGTLLGYTSLNYIFYDLGMNKVRGEVIESNYRSINFHEKLGFNKVDVTFHQGASVNLIIFELTKEQWKEKKEEIKELIEGRLS